MADTNTPNYNLTLVEVGASRDTWGAKTNTNMTSIDAQLKTNATAIATNATNIASNTTAITNNLTTLRNEYKAWLPIGTICLWHTGSSGAVPAGWAICDGRIVNRSDGSGQIGTPNLMGRFILADPNSGQTGGNYTGSVNTSSVANHAHGAVTGNTTLTVAQMPSHTHTGGFASTVGIAQGSFQQGVNARGSTDSTGGDQPHNHSIGADGGHSHTVTMTIVPNYFTLIYIMRI